MSENPPFVIFSLPRCRTAWLSRFLSYGGWECGHDQLRHMRSMDDIKSWLSQPFTGTVETAGAPFWRILHQVRPDTKVVVIRSDIERVLDSLECVGMQFDRASMRNWMRKLDAKLDQIEHRFPGAISVRFEDLAKEDVCAQLFEHCLPYKHDHAWWAAADATNVQINFPAMVRYCDAHRPQLEKLRLTARHISLAMMARPVDEPEGVTIQQESFDDFYRDGQKLFAEHLVQVGESPANYVKKNVQLMRKLDELGWMQITTARSNGRMFGYLMAVLSPSLESEDRTSAIHTTFFASKEFRGLGMKLQRASIESLRAKGVDEVFFRSGVRGDGPRMSSLYRRIGAEEFGELFKLDLKVA